MDFFLAGNYQPQTNQSKEQADGYLELNIVNSVLPIITKNWWLAQ